MEEKNKRTHISFDVWGTLLKANPAYKLERDKLIYKILFPEYGDFEGLKKLIKSAKDFSDYSNEGLGEQLSWRQAMLTIMHGVGYVPDKRLIEDRFKVYEAQHKSLFIYHHPPEAYCDDTHDIIRYRDDLGSTTTLSISCNTSFVPGNLMKEVINSIFGYSKFSYHLYSDEIGHSKPSKEFFKKIIDPTNTVHVGDNPFSDGGSRAVGIPFIHINGDSGKNIFDLLNMIKDGGILCS